MRTQRVTFLPVNRISVELSMRTHVTADVKNPVFNSVCRILGCHLDLPKDAECGRFLLSERYNVDSIPFNFDHNPKASFVDHKD